MRKFTEKSEQTQNLSLGRSYVRNLKNREFANHPHIGFSWLKHFKHFVCSRRTNVGGKNEVGSPPPPRNTTKYGQRCRIFWVQCNRIGQQCLRYNLPAVQRRRPGSVA